VNGRRLSGDIRCVTNLVFLLLLVVVVVLNYLNFDVINQYMNLQMIQRFVVKSSMRKLCKETFIDAVSREVADGINEDKCSDLCAL